MTKLSSDKSGELIRGGTRFGGTLASASTAALAAAVLQARYGDIGGERGTVLAATLGGLGGGLFGRKIGNIVTRHKPATYDFKSKAKEAAKIAVPGLLAAGGLAYFIR